MKRFLALVLALVLCLAVFAGCTGTTESSVAPSSTGSTDESSEAPPVAGDITVKSPTTIKTFTQFAGEDGSAESYANALEAFNALDNNVTADDSSETTTETVKAAIAADFSSGAEPDVIFWFVGPQAVALQGKVVSVDKIKEVYPDYGKNIKDNAINAVKEEDGTAYCLPIKGFWEGLFVNEALFADNNLDLPTTWDKLITACETLSAKGIVPIAQGFSDEPHYLIEAMLAAGGGSDYGTTPHSASEVPASWITGLNGLKLLADAGAFGKNEATLGHGDAVTMLQKGEAAMLADGSWRCGILYLTEVKEDGTFVKQLDAADDEIGEGNHHLSDDFTVMAMPQMPDGKGGNTICAGFSTGWYITEKAWNESEDKRNACIQFVDYMTQQDVLIDMLAGGTPSFDYTPEGLTPVQQAGLSLAANSEFYNPINDRIAVEAWDALWKNAIKVLDGTESAKDILDTAFDLNA